MTKKRIEELREKASDVLMSSDWMDEAMDEIVRLQAENEQLKKIAHHAPCQCRRCQQERQMQIIAGMQGA